MKKMYSDKALSLAPSTTLEITARAAELRNAGVDLVSFGAGEPDVDTPENIKQAAVEALQQGFTKYTATPGILPLREKIAAKLTKENQINYQPNQIIVTNGGKQALFNSLQAVINPGDEVILFAPYWLSYPEMIKMADGLTVVVETTAENGYMPDLADFEKKISPKTKAVLINSPCNPTGAVYSEEILRGIAELALKYDFWVISDEIYEKLIYNGKQHISIASLGEEIYQRTITVNGFSKAYSMTGWRFGYAAADAKVIGLMTKIQSHQTSNINSITQKAALAALDNTDISAMVKAFDKRREFMVNYLKTIPGLRFTEPNGAFYVLLDMREFLKEKGISSREMAKDLLEKEFVAVIPADDFGVEGHIRLSYPISEDKIEKGLERIKKYLS